MGRGGGGQLIVFAGDPHRNFTPIIRACLAHEPGTLILVGDMECTQPLPVLLAPAIEAGWQVRWIMGNHDADTEATFDNLATAHPDGDLGLRVATIDGLRIAGLPGVFKGRVWYPNDGAPQFREKAKFLATLRREDRWRGGLPLWHRDTIFPEDFDRLGTQRFDVLVTHEAPSSHEHGFAVIDELARKAGARLIVHGHHHRSYDATLGNGIAVRGLGLAEPWVMPDRWRVG
jgi:predicted phosphodiesterase